MERACLPEPPWDCLTVTFSPPFCAQCLAKRSLYSLKSSRVGSYETLSRVTSAKARPGLANTAAKRARRARAERWRDIEDSLTRGREGVIRKRPGPAG